MINDSTRESMYREVEAKFPLPSPASRDGAGRARCRPSSPRANRKTPVDLAELLRGEMQVLLERVKDQVLFQLHTVFEFPADATDLQAAVSEALDRQYALERACATNGPYDAAGCARVLFRQWWHEVTDGYQPGRVDDQSLLTGLRHVQQASFFHKAPEEIASWTKYFLQVERYHRLDAVMHEQRLDRYRTLRSSLVPRGAHPFEDLLTWLEFRLLAEPDGVDGDVSALSRQLAEELAGGNWGDLFPAVPLPMLLYILLRCHQFCLSETIEPRESRRFQQILATRQLDTVLDLMRLVMHKTMREPHLPEAGALLDRLQAEGFNIEHHRFRDPYEARLVSITDTERFERAHLPLFVSLAEAAGEFQDDLEQSARQLSDLHRRLAQEAVREYELFIQATQQPLPRARLLHQLVRFATSWVLAQFAWPLTHLPADLEEQVRRLLPESAVRHLVRPRKGYEFKSKQNLQALIVSECQRQREALHRIAANARIQGLHDYAHFIRYLLFQHGREKLGVDLTAGETPACQMDLLSSETQQSDWVIDAAVRWSIDLRQADPHSLESVRVYLQEMSPSDRIMPQLAAGFVTTENERRRIYQGLLEELLPAFHRLVVGFGRAQAQFPRLRLSAQWRADIPAWIALLAPTGRFLEDAARGHIQRYLTNSAGALYRNSLRPHLHNVDEWKAYLAWETHQHLGENVACFQETGDANQLLQQLQEAAEQVVLPPRELFTETVQATLLELLHPARSLPEIPSDIMIDVLALLPRVDCGACGQASCRAFAQALLFDQAPANACVQLPVAGVEILKDRVARYGKSMKAPAAVDSLLEVLRDRRKWQSSPERIRFQKVLAAPVQKTRQLLLERLGAIWRRLSPKPQIFKCPSQDEFYQGLCRYLGYEAAERLQRAEKQLLADHGDVRHQVEWSAFKGHQDWLGLSRRQRQSAPSLRQEDPAWVAREGYQQVFFLHQLSPRDRELVLRHRLERHQDGFSHWWNEDLLAMNLPDFSIRDWEDFSRIIKNAYWHQEVSLPGGNVLAVLQEGRSSGSNTLPKEADPVHMLHAYLERLMGQEQTVYDYKQKVLQQYREGRSVVQVEQLRELLEAFVDDCRLGGENKLQPMPVESLAAGLKWPGAAEDQQALELESTWERFQDGGFVISPTFLCRWEELLPEEQEALEGEMGRSGVGFARPKDGAALICKWDQPLRERAGFLRTMLLACILRRRQEQIECDWLQTKLRDRSPGRPPLGSIRLLIRQRLRAGMERRKIQEELSASLDGASAYPGLIDGWCDDLLHHLACKRQFQLSSGFPGLILGAPSDSEEDSVLYRYPVLTSFLDRLLDRHLTMDRERLLRYVFLLAKMEGNLDALTALLREIRATSDVIEAAWLRFTEERVVEGPAPKRLPGASLGIPLLVSHLKEKDAINRGLREGIGRREKRQVAAAYYELLNFIRYHVLLQADHQGQVEDVLTDINRAGYDLQGIDEAALATVVEKEWKRRDQLGGQKIMIFTSVTARRLAAQHAELQEAERLFYKIRADLLKDAAEPVAEKAGTAVAPAGVSGVRRPAAPMPADSLQDIVRRRGVALGQIKEEMYRQLSDLLETERMATFQTRIRQIVEELDLKRREIHEGWYRGIIDDRTVFYLLRQYQKSDTEPTWDDFRRFMADHWFGPLEALRSSQRPDREQRLQDLDERFRALLGISLLQLEQETAALAQLDIDAWLDQQRQMKFG